MLGNSITLVTIVSILISIISLIFLPQILTAFGMTEALKGYSLDYGYIIALGFPFVMIGITVNCIIRADGNPKYSMMSMVVGTVLNIILDAVFIFVFKMGIKGAAIATVISQFVTFILNVAYIKKLKTIKLNKNSYKLDRKVVGELTILGASSFVNQICMVIVLVIANNLLGKYGETSMYGKEIPITVFGIVLKVSQIVSGIIIGLSIGTQPIVGYNYGAKKFDRVKKTVTILIKYSVLISFIAFILFQTIPDKIILAFGSADENYIEFAKIAFRIFLFCIVGSSIQILTGIFFQAIGRGKKSSIISLSRQIIFLIPLMFILGNYFGIIGLLVAGPIADSAAFILSTIFLLREFRKFKVEENKLKNEIKYLAEVNEI